MEDNNQLSFPEEDEDLEALRLAALQSLKRKTSNEIQTMGHFGKEKLTHFNGSPRGKSKRGKFQRQIQGRSPRNGQFNGWTRNSNLIAVPMVTEEENLSDNKRSAPVDVPKLILPQDRYCKLEKTPEKPDTLTSKFDRYDNSDESESDSEEEETCKLETEDRPDLPRSSSLEALMAELENEIQGVSSKPEEAPKPKPKKKRKSSVATSPKPVESKPPPVLKENLKPETHEPAAFRQRKWPKPRRNHPPNFPAPLRRPVAPPPEVIQPMVAFVPPPVQSFPPFNPIGFDGVYVPPPVVFEAPPPQLPPMCVVPPVYERPLSPLAINTEYSTCTLAPLSPRSAAFVMENRAIVEKRKRRSWSRSPSPGRFRRSKTPKRLSLSPNRPARSPKRRSLSPSPVRKVLLPRTNSPKKPPIHDRLGVKSNKTEPDDESKDKNKTKDLKKEEKKEVLDPVLEARRRKFERKEITMTEGVIRLKKEKQEEIEDAKKEETKTEDEEDIDEDALLEGDGDAEDSLLLDHKIDALFSDEESDSDNEGRFKTKQANNQKSPKQKVAILPFNKLINGSKGDARAQSKVDEKKNDRPKSDRRKRFRSRTPVAATPKRVTAKVPKKNEKVKQPIGFVNERKIEIKIRNPAKYEKADEEKPRKVEVAKEDQDGEKVKESAEEAANTNITEVDLRAQLSRKRAERQKHPLPDVVPTRLLQNALQGVGFRKGKKSKSKDENSEGKLPIHLRLGAATASPELFGKKSRKHKNKGASQEQVLCFVASFLIVIIFSLLKLFDRLVRTVESYSDKIKRGLCHPGELSVH